MNETAVISGQLNDRASFESQALETRLRIDRDDFKTLSWSRWAPGVCTNRFTHQAALLDTAPERLRGQGRIVAVYRPPHGDPLNAVMQKC